MADASVIVTITNELGLHAKPAMAFGAKASEFASDMLVTRTDNGTSIDGKSLLGMLTLELSRGTEIRVDATGEDAQSAVDALAKLVRAKFGED